MDKAQLKSLLIAVILYMQDLYIDLSAFLYKYYIKMIVLFAKFISWFKQGDVKIIAAVDDDGNDITHIVKLYYVIDTIMSVASLHRWLLKFKNPCDYITLIIKNNKDTQITIIDLDKETDSLTSQPLPDDMDINMIPGRKFVYKTQ